MTLKEIRNSDKIMLIPSDIEEVLGSDRHTIRRTAERTPERLQFPFTIIGNRMKIPRESFLRWYDGEEARG